MIVAGQPLSELEQVHAYCPRPNDPAKEGTAQTPKNKRANGPPETRSPSSIVFLRRSMLYSRHASWSNGKMVAGLGKSRKLHLSFMMIDFLVLNEP